MLIRSDDDTLTQESNMYRWIQLEIEATTKVGREPNPGPKLERWVRDAGFVNIKHHVFKLPLGHWPKDQVLKEIGLLNIANCLNGLEAFSMRLMCDVLGWTEEEVHKLLAKVRREMMAQQIHGYNNL